MQYLSIDLTNIGANHEIHTAFRQYAGHGLVLGRVSHVHRDLYRLLTAEGELNAQALGSLLYRAVDGSALPAVGDWVAAQRIVPGEAMIHAVLPRKTAFSRRAPGAARVEQVVATNIDLVLVVCGLDGDFNLRRIERYLTLVRASGAEAAVVLNKTDLCTELEVRLKQTGRIARGALVVSLCAQSGDGVERVVALTGAGRTVALLGSSGAGKSTLVNRLLGEERQPVREVRASDSRGRHTTTCRELLLLPGGGAIIDTPGLRELQLWADLDSLDSAFDDIAELALHCRFRNCSHTVEQGCAVAAAVLDGTLDAARLQSYDKLRAEIAWQERRSDPEAARAQKERWKKIHKAMRAYYKQR